MKSNMILKTIHQIRSNSTSLVIRRFLSQYQPSSRLYEEHIPTNFLQKCILGVGSSIAALNDPWRADMIAVNGEVTGYNALYRLRDAMKRDEEGLSVLQERPRIKTSTVNFDQLRGLPPNTLGFHYASYNDKWKITPDSRRPVKFVDDEELAYVMQRYREVHDLVHSVLNMPTNMVGEVVVKWIEGLQTGLPMCIGGAIFGPLRFTEKQSAKFEILRPWAIRVGLEARLFMNIYYERRWEQDLNDFRKEMNIEPPPSLNK